MGAPLAGLRVLDFTWVLAGPYATMVLADLGAEVIKIEMPGSGDFTRRYAPFFGDVSHYFLSINRGKKSVTLNLKSERGVAIARELARESDILVENFVPGTMEKLGLGYDVMKELNPRLIYASCSGFGQTGPYVQRPAFDIIVQALAGTMSITGQSDGPPARVGFSVGDLGGSLFTAVGVLAALHERERSGLGQLIDVGLLDCQVALLENVFTRYFASGVVPQREGTRHPVIAPFQAYPTRDGEFVVAAGNERQWAAFCRALGLDHLVEQDRFASVARRAENVAELEREVTAVTRQLTTDECLARLEAADVPCSPVHTVDQVVQDPQLAARGMFTLIEHPRAGSLKVVGTPVKMSRSVPAVGGPCPDLGEHTQEVLAQLLGLSNDEIGDLRRQGAI